MVIRYCSRCHQEAFRIQENGDTIKVVQSGNAILNINRKSTVSMSITCPSGHPVKLEIRPEVEDGAGQRCTEKDK